MNPKSKRMWTGIGVLIIVVIVSIIGSSNSAEKQSFDKAKEASEFVKNYVGKDGTGLTVLGTIMDMMNKNEEAIIGEPTWEITYDVRTSSTVYDVVGKFSTSDGNKEFHFSVDLSSGAISSTNELGSDILKLVENE